MNRPPSPEGVDGTGGFARVVHRSRVEWSDTDASGHHHNTATVRFVEAAEEALATAATATVRLPGCAVCCPAPRPSRA
ncbi:hypothetical protein SVIO_105240 [Streptomyces violaceusniger]|uniref:Thioesterase domain-containing protein n=1 Tax=Streptomyces violaceusniger TaxID=68280 RepID=A0A4D4LE85_STRVO|nr:hypothetical protein SVIO_105240 [Streptomyces violaceusniger]